MLLDHGWRNVQPRDFAFNLINDKSAGQNGRHPGNSSQRGSNQSGRATLCSDENLIGFLEQFKRPECKGIECFKSIHEGFHVFLQLIYIPIR